MDYTLLSSANRRDILLGQIGSMEEQHFRATTGLAIALAAGKDKESAEFGLTIRQSELALEVLRPMLEAEQPTEAEMEAAAHQETRAALEARRGARRPRR